MMRLLNILIFFILCTLAFSKTTKEIIENLMSPDDRVFGGAMEYLFESEEGTEEITKEVINSLEDDRALVRRIAIRYLGIKGIKKEIQKITCFLLNDPDKTVREEAASALGEKSMLDAQSIIPLVTSLKDTCNWVRANAIIAIGRIGHKETVLNMKHLLSDKDKYVRKSYISALGYLEDKETMPLLKEGLRDKEGFVRKSAVVELAKIGDTNILPQIKEVMLNDPYSKEIDAGTRGGQKGEKMKVYPVREEAEKLLKKLESR